MDTTAFRTARASGSRDFDPADLERAISGYDQAFETKLVGEIIEAIANASMLTDGDGRRVMALRLSEAASALTSVLASTLALSPHTARSPKPIKQIALAFREKLRKQVAAAERDQLFADFKSRCFHDDDSERGGNA